MSRDSPQPSPPAPASPFPPLPVPNGQALSASDYLSRRTWLQAPHSFQPSAALSPRQALRAAAIAWGSGQGRACRRWCCWPGEAPLVLEILNAIFHELQEGCGGSRAGAWMEVSLTATPASCPRGTGAAAPSQGSHPAHVLPQGRQDMSPSLSPYADGASRGHEQRGSPGPVSSRELKKPWGLDVWVSGGGLWFGLSKRVGVCSGEGAAGASLMGGGGPALVPKD